MHSNRHVLSIVTLAHISVVCVGSCLLLKLSFAQAGTLSFVLFGRIAMEKCRSLVFYLTWTSWVADGLSSFASDWTRVKSCANAMVTRSTAVHGLPSGGKHCCLFLQLSFKSQQVSLGFFKNAFDRMLPLCDVSFCDMTTFGACLLPWASSLSSL